MLFLVGWVLMLLWNIVAVGLGLQTISFSVAVAIVALLNLLRVFLYSGRS
jgi:hypothetical protein